MISSFRLLALSVVTLLLTACQPAARPTAAARGDVQAVGPTAAEQTETDAVWSALEDRYLAINVKPADPVEALEWTEVRCNFLAGEFGGDNSAQDRAVNARMDELGCGDPMLAGARVLRIQRAGDVEAVARLDGLLARHEY